MKQIWKKNKSCYLNLHFCNTKIKKMYAFIQNKIFSFKKLVRNCTSYKNNIKVFNKNRKKIEKNYFSPLVDI